jgi:hypothetical protein
MYLTTEAVLVGSVLGLGVISGASYLRDAANAEFEDMANSLRSVNQSYSYPEVRAKNGAYTAGSSFKDPYVPSQAQPEQQMQGIAVGGQL